MEEAEDSFSEFLEAVEKGNLKEAAAILRRLPSLSKQDLEILADYFDPGAFKKLYPVRLKTVRNSPGRPKDPFKKRAKDESRAKAVREKRKEEPKIYRAIEEAAKEIDVSQSTLRRALRSRKPKKKVTNPENI